MTTQPETILNYIGGQWTPSTSGKRYEDWVLDDPAGQGIEAVRPIRDEIRSRVEKLIAELV